MYYLIKRYYLPEGVRKDNVIAVCATWDEAQKMKMKILSYLGENDNIDLSVDPKPPDVSDDRCYLKSFRIDHSQ